MELTMRPLKFRDKLLAYRQMFSLSIGEMAKRCELSYDRMEDLIEAKHQPLAADLIRIQKGTGIVFDPDDFEEYGQ